MLGLSLWNPWAALVAIGGKRIETRCWETSYRGPVLICSTKGQPAWSWDILQLPEFQAALQQVGVNPLDGHAKVYRANPLFRPAHALAVAWLEDCLPIALQGDLCMWQNGNRLDLPGKPERLFGHYDVGRFAWLLHGVRPLPEPFPIVGGQKLWKLKADVLARVQSQIDFSTRPAGAWTPRPVGHSPSSSNPASAGEGSNA